MYHAEASWGEKSVSVDAMVDAFHSIPVMFVEVQDSSHTCSLVISFQVYQSLEHELQKHVSRQDTLQQCQAWLSAVQPDLKPSPHPPLSRAEAVKQVGTPGSSCYVTYSGMQ